ncbi:LPS export ABC transporter periplasmic protein LptC [Thalassovita sp.]|jgi:lipopolysaccharide export system protein LptC|uniref:LPS export ABC transporter periplasmic protein LptC n=1 Tax=Thalassovita sp. TaxID=1979401 RepID=UPI003B5ACD3E
MAFHESLYSRLVRGLKIILPLAALVLLSTVFLLSRGRDTTDSIPYARVDLQERINDGVINRPHFSGATRDGDLITFVAETAKPDPDDNARAEATKLAARIDLTSGTRITFDADTALLDTNLGNAHLTGGVSISSSTGYSVQTEGLRSSMQEISAESDGPVTGTGPGGQFDAGKMILTTDNDTGAAHLLFTNGVKLVYQPQN